MVGIMANWIGDVEIWVEIWIKFHVNRLPLRMYISFPNQFISDALRKLPPCPGTKPYEMLSGLES